MIAMLLAGGQGSRLGVLTTKVAKPAVSFGGKYRIIDFVLSNSLKPYQVRRAGDAIDDVLTVLSERQEYETIEIPKIVFMYLKSPCISHPPIAPQTTE